MKTRRSIFPSSAASVLLVLLAASLTGCSTFHRDWKQALAQPIPAAGIEGPWDGRWISEVNGHNGRLRCLISKQGNEYQARFHANYKRILSFGYPVVLHVRETNGIYSFEGEADLGRLAGGVYHYAGEATATNFFSRYRSQRDHGTFQMRRPAP